MNHLTTHKHRESSYLRAYYLRAYKALHLSRVLYKSTPFMQNKPNLLDALMNVSSVLTKDYEKSNFADVAKTKPIQSQSKPIQSQYKPNLPDAQMNVSAVITREYENKSNCKLGENKPNTKPIKANIMPKQTQYEPNQTQFLKIQDNFSLLNLPHISDIYRMEAITFKPPRTKQCPFCAETIQARAIKCRFCGEFINTEKAKKALQEGSTPNSAPANEEEDENVLFSGRPSLWGMAGSVIKGLFFLGIAGFLMAYPLEELSMFQQTEDSSLSAYDAPTEPVPESEVTENIAKEASGPELTEEQVLPFRKYRILAGVGLVMLVMLILLMKVVKLKMTHYEVSANRIEYSRGILDRRVDNLDMFRVIDLKLRRNLLDCIVGIGTVELITTDKTDPEFVFEKIRNSRRLYDIIKKASLDADRRNSVIHLE